MRTLATILAYLAPFYLMIMPILSGIYYMLRYRTSDAFDNFYCNKQVNGRIIPMK